MTERYNYLRKGYAYAAFVCLSVSRITQKVFDEFCCRGGMCYQQQTAAFW